MAPRFIGYVGNCGHWINVKFDFPYCIHNPKIKTPDGIMEIKGIGEKCPECFPDAGENEIVAYARKDNVISVAPLELRDYCKLLQACISI